LLLFLRPNTRCVSKICTFLPKLATLAPVNARGVVFFWVVSAHV
jgi:hypothetical protein